MTSIIQGTQGTGSCAQFREIANVTFPVLTATNELYVIDTTNSQPCSTLLVEKTKDNIISLVVLLKAGFKVDFDLWHIPMWRPPSIVPPRAKSLPCGEGQ